MSRALIFMLLYGLMIALPDRAARQDSYATQRPAAQKQDERSLKPGHLSPYLLEWFLDINEDADLKEIWRLLKIETPDDMTYNCRGGCDAETFEIDEADKSHGKTVALKISFAGESFYQFLFFRRIGDGSGEEWKFIGNIDSVMQQYEPPKHRLEKGDGRTWFVIGELWGRGTEVLVYGDVWYEIGESKIKRVLSYPVEGHYDPCQGLLGRYYKSLLLRSGVENGVYTIPVQFLVSYIIPDCRKNNNAPALFASSRKATFVWDSALERFVPDPARSEITEAGIVGISEGLANERFVEDNFDDLLKIARGNDSKKKEWLREFLTALKESRFKTALRQAL